MKQKLLVFGLVALVVLVGVFQLTSFRRIEKGNAVSSQPQAESAKKVIPEAENTMMDDSHVLGIVFKDGKPMTVWEHDVLDTLKHDITLKNGTIAKIDGSIVTKEGSLVSLKDNEELTTDGQIVQVDITKMMAMKEGEMMGNEDSMHGNDSQMATAGQYIAYSVESLSKSQQSGGRTVLFFHAGWCPMCKTDDADIRAHLDRIPKDVTILITDYDKETDLKQKYGITYQNTYVQIDKGGKAVTKWNNGGQGLNKILSSLKSL